MSSYVYPLDQLNNNPPRAFIFSSLNQDADALVLDSLTAESRLRFINSVTDNNYNPNFVLSASNQLFSLQKNNCNIIDYNLDDNSNAVVNLYGSLNASNLTISSNAPSYRAIVLQDFDPTSSNQFAGLGYSNNNLNFQIPFDQANAFTFTINSNQVFTIQEDINGNAQMGIGVSNLLSNISLQTQNDLLVGGTLHTSSIVSPTNYINLNYNSLCNLGELHLYQIGLASIVSTCNNNIKFNYAGITEVDTLIVRSNITVLNPGLFSYCNLPINTVFTDSNTGKIQDTIISSNLARLQNDGTLNPALFPPGYSSRSTLLRTQDKVGIGLRYPQQKLHVSGNQCITEGRLSIGTSNPVATFDIFDNSSAPYTFQIVNVGSTDMMRIYSSDQMVFNISGTCNVGIMNSAPLYTLDVNGDIHTNAAIHANAIMSDNALINCYYTTLSNAFNINAYSLDTGSIFSSITNSINLNNNGLYNVDSINVNSINVNSLSCTAPLTNIQFTNAVNIVGFDTNLYDPTSSYVGGDTQDTSKIGLKVNECILARSYLATSDKRTKINIKNITKLDSLNKLLKIDVKKFNYVDTPDEEQLGFIAQELEKVYPEAVNTITNAIPNIKMKVLVVDEIYVNNEDYLLDEHKYYKFCNNGIEYIRKVVKITTTNHAKFNEPLIVDDDGFAFLYGEYVNDFKVIDYNRLIPLIISSIQEIYDKNK